MHGVTMKITLYLPIHWLVTELRRICRENISMSGFSALFLNLFLSSN